MLDLPPILLEEALERRPTGTSVQEDSNLVNRSTSRGLEDEEECVAGVGVVDRDEPSIQLTQIEGHVWEILDSIC